MKLAPEKIAALREYLLTFPAKERREGLRLLERGRFRVDPHAFADTIFGTAIGSGSSPYDITVTFDSGKWAGDCTCYTRGACKHCYALAQDLLNKTAPPPDPASVTPGTPIPAATKAPAAASYAATRPPSVEAQFIQEIAAKLGRNLEVSEKVYLIHLVRLWVLHRNSSRIVETAFTRLLSKPISWSSAPHQIWTATPESPWEAWLQFAVFLAKHKQPIPPFLSEITDLQKTDAMAAEWQRRARADQWRTTLRNLVHQSPQIVRRIEFRVALEKTGIVMEWRDPTPGAAAFAIAGKHIFHMLEREFAGRRAELDPASRVIWGAFLGASLRDGQCPIFETQTHQILLTLLTNPLTADQLFTAERVPYQRADSPLHFEVIEPETDAGDYEFRYACADGTPPSPALLTLASRPAYYITADTIYETPALSPFGTADATKIPAAAVESTEGARLFDLLQTPLPARFAAKVEHVDPRVILECTLGPGPRGSESIHVRARADFGPDEPGEVYEPSHWKPLPRQTPAPADQPRRVLFVRRDPLARIGEVLTQLRLTWNAYSTQWHRPLGPNFPAVFTEWIRNLPADYEVRLDPQLATLRHDPLPAKIRLDVSESGIDWFDLRVQLDVADTELTQEELALLVAADGEFVRLGNKGWRRLIFNLSPEEERALAESGLDARDFSGENQRLHALQLSGKSAERLLPAPQVAAIRRRVEDIQTRVVPPIPSELRAELRPYQVTGYHFLAYLSTNHFGGILADDMGLGKTLQTLAWLAWLRSQPDTAQIPSLVVCPKSVVLNWHSEAQRFLPGLRVTALNRVACTAETLKKARAESDLVVLNYAQLRLLETELLSAPWLAAILDEAQFIKNPDSQTAKIAVQLKATHRLALTGTPIENRLLDLWSIISFAMPGVLGIRARFQKSFDQRNDPFARVRLAARVRPFLLRRTKSEVAKDLPERIEEDLYCEMEGLQATLYSAELKRARQMLLKISTSEELDRDRFNILTSLLRLRQICCHPALVSETAAGSESAKLTALLELLEPLMEEGHKVLVFSQFTSMLDLVAAAVRQREWPSYLLTGATEDRQPLVEEFQNAPGAAVFLISLRAGGIGLNLTAASYVVLFDPWWNPAVENQAIDRTHRIGQTNQVNAYRLVVKNSIEEKIRNLQNQKRALADDILGEESFTRALTLEDFRFLLGDEVD